MINTQAAVRLFREQPKYSVMTPEEEYETVVTPIRAGRMVAFFHGDGIGLFTWTRPGTVETLNKLLEGKADAAVWADFAPERPGYSPWIVDVVAHGISGVVIGRMLRWVTVHEKIAYDGQRVLFHRNGGIRTGRIGYFTARRL